MPPREPQPERRAFFQSLTRKAGKAVIQQVDKRVAQRAVNWIRPPWALPELEFLLACTRCGDCIQACPHQVVFPLPARLGLQVGGTPALNLRHRGCHCCADWPCAAACQPQALRQPNTPDDAPDDQPPPMPKLASTRLERAHCLAWQGPECGACASACPIEGALTWRAEKPAIDPNRCNGCGRCREACIMEPKAIQIRPLTPQTTPEP